MSGMKPRFCTVPVRQSGDLGEYFRRPRPIPAGCWTKQWMLNPIWMTPGSTWVQVWACCLTAPSHYLNRCWLIINPCCSMLYVALHGVLCQPDLWVASRFELQVGTWRTSVEHIVYAFCHLSHLYTGLWPSCHLWVTRKITRTLTGRLTWTQKVLFLCNCCSTTHVPHLNYKKLL